MCMQVVSTYHINLGICLTVTSSRGNRWSQLTVKMGKCLVIFIFSIVITYLSLHSALAVYSRSRAAYEALRSFKLLQLPCVRTLKYYIDANLESAGDSLERLQQSRKQYCALVEERKIAFEDKKRAVEERKKTAGESSNESNIMCE